MEEKLDRDQLKPGTVWIHKDVTSCVVIISELKNDQVYYRFSRNGGLGILKTGDFLEGFELARNKLLEPGATIWHRRDDYNEEVIITNFDGNTVSYQYPGVGYGVRCGRANIESFLMDFMREYPEYERIPVGSIWKGVRGCSEELKGKLIKVVRFTGSIISWMCIEDGYNMDADVTGTSRSSFLYCFDKVKDNDNDALYGFRDTPGNVVKVIKTKVISDTKNSFRGSIEFFAPMKDREKSSIRGLIDFHTVYRLISLDPVGEYTVPTDSVNHLTVNPEEDEIKPNQIWMNKIKFRGQPVRYVKVEKPVHDNVVHWINIGNGNEISWTNVNVFLKYYEKIAENDEGYEYVDRRNVDTVVTVLPYKLSGVVCYKMKNEHDFREDVRKFHEIYEPWGLAQLRRNNMENETKTEVKEEPKFNTYLKTDASKLEAFEDGAKREDKSGKGRYDLIPGKIMREFELYTYKKYFEKDIFAKFSKYDVSLNAYFDEVGNVEKFFDLIVSIIAVKYIPEHLQIGETVNEIFYTKACWASFHRGIVCMRKALADHYEAGAKVHGVNNWKKGIPISDSERGGNFVDSMRRHTDQYLDDKTDEPHAIAAIWNAFCAAWTIKNI